MAPASLRFDAQPFNRSSVTQDLTFMPPGSVLPVNTTSPSDLHV